MKDKLKETLSNILSYLLKVERRTLLWTNANPTATFAPQQVSVDLSDYDEVEVSFMLWTGYQQTSNIMRCKVGANAIVTAVASSNNYAVGSRPDPLARAWDFTVANGVRIYGGVEANFASQGAFATANHVLIPYKIYGIKYGGYCLAVFSRLTGVLRHRKAVA